MARTSWVRAGSPGAFATAGRQPGPTAACWAGPEFRRFSPRVQDEPAKPVAETGRLPAPAETERGGFAAQTLGPDARAGAADVTPRRREER